MKYEPNPPQEVFRPAAIWWIYLSAYLSICLSVCLCACVCMLVSVGLPTCRLSLCAFAWLSVCLCLCTMSICVSVWLSICLAAWLSGNLYFRLYVCLFVYLASYSTVWLSLAVWRAVGMSITEHSAPNNPERQAIKRDNKTIASYQTQTRHKIIHR